MFALRVHCEHRRCPRYRNTTPLVEKNHFFSVYRLLLLPPFSRKRWDFSIYPDFSRSAIARLTVENESFVSFAIVRRDGKQVHSLLLLSSK